jgi:predicted esterase
MTVSSTVSRFGLALGLVVASAATLGAQDAPPFRPGQLVERATAEDDSSQHYAVFVPSSYRADRMWPLLLLLDPRGRALIPLTRVRAVAERLGYLVMSSYNSRSDEFIDPNADAINAMLHDAQRFFALDQRRVYLVGQSGTARADWVYGYQLKGHVAGLIGFGAALPRGFEFTPRPADQAPIMVFFGAAGTTDYNFDEMFTLDTLLERVNFPHRISWFEGPHAWPGEPVLTEAVEWVELQAMKYGLKPEDPAWIDSTLASSMAEAESLATTGDAYLGWRRYRAIIADFGGLRDVSNAARRERELARGPVVQKIGRHLAETVRDQEAWNARLAAFLTDFGNGSPPPLEKSLHTLGVPKLLRRANGTDDPIDAQAAARRLANIWVYTSFYLPQDYLARGDPDRALAILKVAEAIHPGRPDLCYERARAYQAMQRIPDALTEVECLLHAGIAPERLEHDPLLEQLRSEWAFRALLARTPRPPVAPPGPARAGG